MLQRNATNDTLILPTFEPPISVPPGWEIEHSTLLAGFEPVDAPADPPPPAEPVVEPAPDAWQGKQPA